MNYLGLTTSDQIRAILTVSEEDLPDETLTPYGLEDELQTELEEWLPNWVDVIAEGTPTEAEEEEEEPGSPAPDPEKVKQFRLLRLFAKYFCAAVVARTAPIFVLTKITDGSNEGQRSDTDGFLWLSRDLLAQANRYKSMLLAALGEPDPLDVPTIISRVRPARDPVTQSRDDGGV